MIKKYKQYLKENNIVYSSDEIDPYGEENWDRWDDSLTPVLRLAKKTMLPYDQIIEFNCTNKDWTNLEGIEKLINLEELYCSSNNLTSLKGIENLINLETLYCYRNNLTDLNEIENLINLKDLSCWGNYYLTNLNGIENLINLKDLWCSNNDFSEEYKQYLKEFCKNKKIRLNI